MKYNNGTTTKPTLLLLLLLLLLWPVHYLLDVQNSPSQPSAHRQVNVPIPSLQVAPFLQVLFRQLSISKNSKRNTLLYLSGTTCAVIGWFSGSYSHLRMAWLRGLLSSSIQSLSSSFGSRVCTIKKTQGSWFHPYSKWHFFTLLCKSATCKVKCNNQENFKH